ncbi:hypothetical protein IKT18_03655 [Candidatus Saccharibacteria bacterium]|nr:hypothetical protein [Candidatus Saccharibacteria bacterium]
MEEFPSDMEDLDLDDIVSEDPALVQALADREDAKTKREKDQNRARIVEAIDDIRKREPAKTAGYTIEDDPVFGFTDDPEKMRKFEAEHPMPEAEVEEAPESEVVINVRESVDEELAENEKRLTAVFERSKEIRDRYKKPGNPRYRLMSVAAADMKRIEQSPMPVGEENSAEAEKVKSERIEKNSAEIEKAIRKALGGKELSKDHYAADTLAAAQLYLSEILIGGDADSVSIGNTGTIVSSSGEGADKKPQMGMDPDIYKNLVVVRWIKNGINHVVAFSPREDTGVYALVDDSVGNSWREKFLRAGAVEDKERKDMIIVHHKEQSDTFRREKSIEELAFRTLVREKSILDFDEIGAEHWAEALISVGTKGRKLAHLEDRVEKLSPSEKTEKIAEYAEEAQKKSEEEKPEDA